MQQSRNIVVGVADSFLNLNLGFSYSLDTINNHNDVHKQNLIAGLLQQHHFRQVLQVVKFLRRSEKEF